MEINLPRCALHSSILSFKLYAYNTCASVRLSNGNRVFWYVVLFFQLLNFFNFTWALSSRICFKISGKNNGKLYRNSIIFVCVWPDKIKMNYLGLVEVKGKCKLHFVQQ